MKQKGQILIFLIVGILIIITVGIIVSTLKKSPSAKPPQESPSKPIQTTEEAHYIYENKQIGLKFAYPK